MNTISSNKSGIITLQPGSVDILDYLVKITAGPAAVLNVVPPLNKRVNSSTSIIIQKGQSMTLKYDSNGNFNDITKPLPPLPIPNNISNGTNNIGIPNAPQSLAFRLIAGESTYTFNGTERTYNPKSINLIGSFLPMVFFDGLLKVNTVHYNFDTSTGTLSVTGTVYANVQAVVIYQFVNNVTV